MGDRFLNVNLAATSRAAANSLITCLGRIRALHKRLVIGPVMQSPTASLADFIGVWTGHTRFLMISPSARGSEWVDDGCCHHVYDLTLQVIRVTGTPVAARAAARVLTVRANSHDFDRRHPVPKVGQTLVLSLAKGVLIDTNTGARYCDWTAGAKNLCGA